MYRRRTPNLEAHLWSFTVEQRCGRFAALESRYRACFKERLFAKGALWLVRSECVRERTRRPLRRFSSTRRWSLWWRTPSRLPWAILMKFGGFDHPISTRRGGERRPGHERVRVLHHDHALWMESPVLQKKKPTKRSQPGRLNRLDTLRSHTFTHARLNSMMKRRPDKSPKNAKSHHGSER